jgi:hypothetical protein
MASAGKRFTMKASANAVRTQVLFPVPLGPKRKKADLGRGR